MKTPWIGTSWKMNKTRAEARAFAEALKASPFAITAKALASARVLFIFQLVPIHGVFIG